MVVFILNHLMSELFHRLFYNGPFMPHGHCYLWTPGLLWLHVISDALIVFSYFTIPITLIYFVHKRHDMRFGWIFVCFAVFIVACGTSHVMEIWNVWHSNYWMSGGVKAVTALASVPTAFLLTRLVTPALQLPSLSDLEKLNLALEQEVTVRTTAEEKVRGFNAELEARVRERTAELDVLNADLRRQITERERAQEAARQSEERFRQLADSMPQIVWAARPDGVVDYYNERWHDYTGVAANAMGDAGWEQVVHADDLPRTRETWGRAVRTGEPYEIEYRFKRRSDGAYRWQLGRALPIKDATGSIVRWFGTATDVDDYKRLENDRQRLLESERAARAEAERISQMKDEFLATLSHELRTPLNAIYGWVQVLRGGAADPADVDAGLATIERNARSQKQIIDDLLDMSAIIAGKVRMDVQRVDLASVIEAVLATVRPAADAKGLRLLPVLDPHARPVSGDPNRLQQIFWNLLTNAVKFTPRNGRVQVRLECVDSRMEVRVTDSGGGISPEFLPHVFDRFRQEDASTSRRHGGLGLGLAITKQLVELHGGTVRAESGGADQGATFIVSLPIPAILPDAGTPDGERADAAPATDAPFRSYLDGEFDLTGLKVLVVDDEADARALVQRVLQTCGVVVRTAPSGEEAAADIVANPPDLLVSDIGMPGMDGYELIRRVRQLGPEVGKTPALALTAYARSEDRAKAIRAGFQMHIAKPVEAAELLTMVAMLTGRTG